MELSYLLFDATDDELGACSFDAMASVLPARLPAVVEEVSTVLSWAWREFGPPSPVGDESGWDYDLEALDEAGASLGITFDGEQARVPLQPAREGLVTITLTISGPSAFGSAFREAFCETE